MIAPRMLFVSILGLLLAHGAQAADADAALRSALRPFIETHDIAGAVVIVGRHDAILSQVTLGLQNIEKHQPMPKNALFRIASMTKPITALGIMILADEGKLTVNDPVEKHLPEFRGQMLVSRRDQDTTTLVKPRRPITLRDLLTHTSGMPGSPPAGLADLYRTRAHTLAEGVMAFSQRPLNFEPGSQWSYCNLGIDTLGRVIEVASGQSYEGFLRQRIFEPLGMKDTTFYPNRTQMERIAQLYAKRDGKLVPANNGVIGPPAGARYPIPAGGLFSTGEDLAKLYQMMLRKGVHSSQRIVSEAAVAEMTKSQTGDLKAGFTPGMAWGLGWGVVRQPEGVTAMLSPGTFGHGGAFGTQAWIDLTKDLFVVLLIQRSGLANSDASPMRKAVQEAAFEALK